MADLLEAELAREALDGWTVGRCLVFGGRAFDRQTDVDYALNVLAGTKGYPSLVIHGGARGADSLAGAWARSMRLPVAVYPVSDEEWRRFGKQAGMLRNARMLSDGRPDCAVQLPGGRGTADMRARLEVAGVPVWEPFSEFDYAALLR